MRYSNTGIDPHASGPHVADRPDARSAFVTNTREVCHLHVPAAFYVALVWLVEAISVIG
ncbi:hypothetical protein FHY19_002226 [Xanthomonas arboricola]|nr:hypothetical protein [Xanthomonas sp. 4461]